MIVQEVPVGLHIPDSIQVDRFLQCLQPTAGLYLQRQETSHPVCQPLAAEYEGEILVWLFKSAVNGGHGPVV